MSTNPVWNWNDDSHLKELGEMLLEGTSVADTQRNLRLKYRSMPSAAAIAAKIRITRDTVTSLKRILEPHRYEAMMADINSRSGDPKMQKERIKLRPF